ncbi:MULTISPECIES: RelA/SpoT domain-containing protein [Pseudomonas]|uniref:RelA/SpoT domain-containing protein n=1 Tax=Pseudomonas TaxID=286 RepID=UPI0013047FAE|nr:MULTISPECIES: RelA/SpoT domain-containing protein [Pseudomonas]WSO04747.1 RelA/SpoT domain-containing protein [Pseudomonas lurida]
MAWVTPLYSKERVKKAGITLFNDNATDDEYEEALQILNNWRSSHSYPVNTFQAGLRTKLNAMGINGIVAQRLKRIPSIMAKLERFKNMSLSRMQDIGGLRAVVATAKQVYELRDSYVKKSKFEHVLVSENDYIKAPKESGYRGIHLIYKYNNRKGGAKAYEGLQVELQIRNELQHAWATAVETAGVFLNQALKSSLGNGRWLEFFRYASSSFALLEECQVMDAHRHLTPKEIFDLMLSMETELDVLNNLGMYKTLVEHLKDTAGEKTHYYLLELNATAMNVSVSGYAREALPLATNDYLDREKWAKGKDGIQVVLVAAQSLTALRKAYPNYFLDTGKFVSQINRIKTAVENWDDSLSLISLRNIRKRVRRPITSLE